MLSVKQIIFFPNSLESKCLKNKSVVKANGPLTSGFRELRGSFREHCAFNLLSLVPENILKAAVSYPISCAGSSACLTLSEADAVYKVVNLLQQNSSVCKNAGERWACHSSWVGPACQLKRPVQCSRPEILFVIKEPFVR